MSGSNGSANQPDRRSGTTKHVRVEVLRERYGLTAEEARVAVLVAEGHTVKEIARQLDVTVFTIRAHLRNIFAKTDANRQAALVRIVLRGD